MSPALVCRSPCVEELALPKSVESGKLGLNKAVIRWTWDRRLAPSDGPWPISRVADVSVAQTVYKLVARHRLWLPGIEDIEAIPMPMCRLTALAETGPRHRDINGTEHLSAVHCGTFDLNVTAGSWEGVPCQS